MLSLDDEGTLSIVAASSGLPEKSRAVLVDMVAGVSEAMGSGIVLVGSESVRF